MVYVLDHRVSTHSYIKGEILNKYHKIRAARRQANKLLFRLCNLFSSRKSGSIRLIYAENFGPQKCIVGATIPIGDENITKVVAIGRIHQHYHYPPVIINGKDGLALRLMWRFKAIRPHDHAELQRVVEALAEWLEKLFCRQTVITPVLGLIEAKWRLRAF